MESFNHYAIAKRSIAGISQDVATRQWSLHFRKKNKASIEISTSDAIASKIRTRYILLRRSVADMQIVVGALSIAIAFSWLERKFPVRRQKRLRPGWFTDVCHWVFNQTIVNVGVVIGAIPLYILLGWAINPSFQTQVARQPGYLQLLEAIFFAEVSFYLVHRLFHQVPYLWKFHAIHHSSEHLDWLASVRFHPVDMVAARLGIGVPLVILGFRADTFGFYIVFNLIQSIFIHANVRCRLPLLRWLIGDPQLHHWHHSKDIHNKNFGHPLLDLLFGTLYNPRPGEFPRAVGVEQRVPANYLQQLVYPFSDRR